MLDYKLTQMRLPRRGDAGHYRISFRKCRPCRVMTPRKCLIDDTWLVPDSSTDEVADVNDIPQERMSAEDADDLTDLLNRLEAEKRGKALTPRRASASPPDVP